MKIQFVGTGTMMAPSLCNTAAVINDRILIDCGVTVPGALERLGYLLPDFDDIVITHTHADHAGGLEIMAYWDRYVANERKTVWAAGPVWGELIKMLDVNLKYQGGPGEFFEFDFPVPDCGLDDEGFPIHKPEEVYESAGMAKIGRGDPVTVEWIRTPHCERMYSSSLWLDGDVFYTGDCAFDRELLVHHVCPRAGIIFHDCCFAEESPVHATLRELATLPWWAREEIHLMHYGADVMAHINEIHALGMNIVTPGQVFSLT